jgi:hypothetical protein
VNEYPVSNKLEKEKIIKLIWNNKQYKKKCEQKIDTERQNIGENNRLVNNKRSTFICTGR